MSFENLGLSSSLLKAIEEQGYDKPSPIQEQVIPVVLQGKDVLASAQTGTGKTAGFTLPILEQFTENPHHNLKKRNIRALILTPTRELAAQIQENVINYSKHVDVRSTVIFGGVKQAAQVRALQKGVDILVATPGRLLDLHNQGEVKLNKIEVLVLDEADRMLDMGFHRDIQRIMNLIPSSRQTLLFSATFSTEIRRLASKFLTDPVTVEVAATNTTAERVNQSFYKVDKTSKAMAVIHLLEKWDEEQVLIFCRTKHGASRLSKRLEKKGISSAAIHGDKSQQQRIRALEGFKKGAIRVLVATDIAARGLDIPLLPYVINYEMPNVPADYVHRIGRTGRAGASGDAHSLVGQDETEYMLAIGKLLKKAIKAKVLEGFEPSDNPPKIPQHNKPSSNKPTRKPNGGGGFKKKRPAAGSGNSEQGGNRNARSGRPNTGEGKAKLSNNRRSNRR